MNRVLVYTWIGQVTQKSVISIQTGCQWFFGTLTWIIIHALVIRYSVFPVLFHCECSQKISMKLILHKSIILSIVHTYAYASSFTSTHPLGSSIEDGQWTLCSLDWTGTRKYTRIIKSYKLVLKLHILLARPPGTRQAIVYGPCLAVWCKLNKTTHLERVFLCR